MVPDVIYWIVLGAVGIFASALTIATALKRKGKGYYLCDDCKFNSPQDCLKKERPYALECTSYRVGEVSATVGGSQPAEIQAAVSVPEVPAASQETLNEGS